jgi:hypothetical protein
MYRKFISLLLVAAFLPACGPGHGLTLGRVSGKVTYRGEPVRYGFVTFQPEEREGESGPPAMSTISQDGTYALTTQDPDDGAVVGPHRVAIIALDPDPIVGADAPEPAEAPKEFMATKSGRVKTKSKTAEVPKDAGPTFKSRDGKIYRILGPEKLGNPMTSGIQVEVKSGRNTFDFEIGDEDAVQVR